MDPKLKLYALKNEEEFRTFKRQLKSARPCHFHQFLMIELYLIYLVRRLFVLYTR